MAQAPSTPRTASDLARILGVSAGYLKFVLRRGMRYTVFRIPKKSGGTREIAAPSGPIVQLQRQLLDYLETLYSGRGPSHGFVRGGSILSNARPHVRSRYILNVDLEDFFSTIHFGRVRGMLRGKPYFFGKEAATLAANLCCRNATLPQGAPTSPILANMICAKMDSDLKGLAKKYHCTYTRYADDLTFSTKSQSLPKAIAFFAEETRQLEVGEDLRNAIAANGFRVNKKKLRLLSRHQRQEVTGLTTNRFPNVQRRFIRQIRAMLHAWKKYRHDQAEQEFWKEYDHRSRSSPQPSFSRVVRGKIEFVGSVRGRTDPLYWRLLRQYAALYARDVDAAYELREPPEFVEYDINELKKALWVLTDNTSLGQSTAFYLKDVGLVTCSHAITDPGNLSVFRPGDPLKKEYTAHVKHRSEKMDLAIMEASCLVPKMLRLGDDGAIKQGDPIRLMGFPQHDGSADVAIQQGYLVNEYKFEGMRRLNISAPIIPGNSGGPVLNDKNRVVGVAIKGGAGELNAVVPIGLVLQLGPSSGVIAKAAKSVGVGVESEPPTKE